MFVEIYSYFTLSITLFIGFDTIVWGKIEFRENTQIIEHLSYTEESIYFIFIYNTMLIIGNNIADTQK